ncbi:unnamed protein product [marine sediment metagenome]|uniref:Uncharacterized protein n=1 Tax=marine sediment metagenome TaxID=412755 RepID=X0VHI5_9ZZZZ
MNHHEIIYDVLAALGDRTLSTGEIIPGLKVWSPTRRELSGFLSAYMENRYVEKIRNYKGAQRLVKWRVLAR